MLKKVNLKRKRKMFDLKVKIKSIKLMIPTLYFAMKHKETPIFPKVLAAIVVAYALSPIDLIPDFIPVLGFLDDAVILPGLIALIIKLIPQKILEECKEQARVMWDGKAQHKWIYALPVIIIYALVIIWVVSLIVS
ncbi:MAG: hypothetical protein FD133_1096 [Erysipelotrichaceae bacterium]|nr:MAG: hypothetical protein FD179_460 [Erysipelotrichaceae bacterium]TXT18086.1 MAG: hypothetical protein FD133_1096 [Erysipelotrichaceae bacterium]